MNSPRKDFAIINLTQRLPARHSVGLPTARREKSHQSFAASGVDTTGCKALIGALCSRVRNNGTGRGGSSFSLQHFVGLMEKHRTDETSARKAAASVSAEGTKPD
jgi:hypothetical protein